MRWYVFTRGCRITVLTEICDPQVKTFPMMYHVGLSETFTVSTCLRVAVWDSIVSPDCVGSRW